MNIDLRKTTAQIDRCLSENCEMSAARFRRMYDLTLRLQSQLLSVIYDIETFGGVRKHRHNRIADLHSTGQNENSVVVLTISEALPPMKGLTVAIEEHWKAMIHAAIEEAARQAPLPYFGKAMVEIEVITPRGSNNARLWDTSNRAINVIINNLKGIFLRTTIWSIWRFQWLDGGAKKALRSSVF